MWLCNWEIPIRLTLHSGQATLAFMESHLDFFSWLNAWVSSNVAMESCLERFPKMLIDFTGPYLRRVDALARLAARSQYLRWAHQVFLEHHWRIGEDSWGPLLTPKVNLVLSRGLQVWNWSIVIDGLVWLTLTCLSYRTTRCLTDWSAQCWPLFWSRMDKEQSRAMRSFEWNNTATVAIWAIGHQQGNVLKLTVLCLQLLVELHGRGPWDLRWNRALSIQKQHGWGAVPLPVGTNYGQMQPLTTRRLQGKP